MPSFRTADTFIQGHAANITITYHDSIIAFKKLFFNKIVRFPFQMKHLFVKIIFYLTQKASNSVLEKPEVR